MNARTFFITGVPGTGKSTIIEPLKLLLGAGFEVYDFDERGVPDNVNSEWRRSETAYWLKIGEHNSYSSVSTIICGFVMPDEVASSYYAVFILLDADELTIKSRLLQRYSNPQAITELQRMRRIDVEQSIIENTGALPHLREACKARGAYIIDTTNLTPNEAAKKVALRIREDVGR